MSPAEQPHSQATDHAIETIYTTVEAQPDRTDWLTVVSNLRHVNRQRVEEIARLEEALASAKQTLHIHKERNQSHEVTILQQQDELSIAHDRVGALFQQLETSHQIGQRQQTLIETLSQQLEIVQNIVPQIEAEHEELRQKYQQQSQKLAKTEQVAVELHRRLKLQASPVNRTTPTPVPEPTDPIATTSTSASTVPSAQTDLAATDLLSQHTATETIASAQVRYDRDLINFPPATEQFSRGEGFPPTAATLAISPLAATNTDSTISTTELDPAPPLAPIELPQRHSSLPTLAQTTILSPSKPADPSSWREAIATSNATIRYNSPVDSVASLPPQAAQTANNASLADTDPAIATSTANWPAPTLDRNRSIAKPVKIDLPKFPKK